MARSHGLLALTCPRNRLRSFWNTGWLRLGPAISSKSVSKDGERHLRWWEAPESQRPLKTCHAGIGERTVRSIKPSNLSANPAAVAGWVPLAGAHVGANEGNRR